MSQGQITTLTAPAGPAVHDRSPPWEAPAETARGGNGKLRVLGLVAVGTVGAVVAWDLRRRGLPELDEAAEFAPHLLLATPLLAGLGMLAGRRPPTWAGLLLGAGAWSVLGAVWSVRWLVAAGGRLVGGSEDPLEFAKGLTWVPYTALVVLGLVVLVTVLALRAHPARTSCRTGGHRLLTFGAAAVALLGPLWVLALVPAMGLGARRPHRTAAVAWAGWVIQGVVALTLAANGEIPSSGLPALVLHPDAPTAVLLGVPLLLVAAFAGALATLPAEACRWDEPLRAYAPTSPIDWPEPEERGPLSDR